jgi:hypothetical protein
MAWIIFGLAVVGVVAALSSLWWAHRPMLTGVVLVGLCIVSMMGMSKQAAWGVDEVRSDAESWCLTYEHPDGSRFTECRPTEDQAWAWADALDAELETEFGPREQDTPSGIAFGVLFYVSLVGAVVSGGWAYAAKRRASGE